jgi:hypothetical protein
MEPTSNVYFANVTLNGSTLSQPPLGIENWFAVPTPYPIPISATSCSIYDGYIYCVGGESSNNGVSTSYFAQLSNRGLDPWVASTRYPLNVSQQSCNVYNGYLYCVGGFDASKNNYTNATYYAPVSKSGIGAWSMTTPYPLPVAGLSCALANSIISCVGGALGSGRFTNATYFTNISASGIGAWFAMKAYPLNITDTSCVTAPKYANPQ